MEIQNIFKELREVYLCESAYDFSTNYLGKSKSYYSVLKANNVNPSIGTLATLETALKEKAKACENQKYKIFAVRRDQLLTLSERVSTLRQKQCINKLKQLKEFN